MTDNTALPPDCKLRCSGREPTPSHFEQFGTAALKIGVLVPLREAPIIFPDAPGVYGIVFTPDGKLYVGSSRSLSSRLSTHLVQLINNQHYNFRMQRLANTYGIGWFAAKIFTIEPADVTTDELVKREQFWIDVTRAYQRWTGFNYQRNADYRKTRRRNDNDCPPIFIKGYKPTQ